MPFIAVDASKPLSPQFQTTYPRGRFAWIKRRDEDLLLFQEVNIRKIVLTVRENWGRCRTPEYPEVQRKFREEKNRFCEQENELKPHQNMRGHLLIYDQFPSRD
jgi:hypothetical protein